MSQGRAYQIPHKGSTIATYWLIQWVGIVMLVATLAAVAGGWTSLIYQVLSLIIAATVWTAIIMIAQAAHLIAPVTVGGRREIGKLRSGVSITVAALGVTGLCSLVMWLLIAGLGLVFNSGDAAIPLALVGMAGMIALFVLWSALIHAFLGKGRREEQYAELTKRMLAGTGLCAMLCAGIAVIATVVAGDDNIFLAVMAVSTPWLVGAAIALLGCRLYLKRLWRFRAPWYETHCAECGYDLSGNLNVTQCSECGTPWKHVAIVPVGSKRAEGKCEGCNYDMSGTPDADKCPECGIPWKHQPLSTPPEPVAAQNQ